MTHSLNSSNETVLFKGFITLTERIQAGKNGPFPYITVHTKPNSVMVVPIYSDGSILIAKEMRHAICARVLSFPAGLVDEGEQCLEAAKRELLEETGHTSERWTKLGTCYPLPGLLNQTMHVFLAADIVYCQAPKLDEIEDIETERLSFLGLCSAFARGGNVDANALAALALLLTKSASTTG